MAPAKGTLKKKGGGKSKPQEKRRAQPSHSGKEGSGRGHGRKQKKEEIVKKKIAEEYESETESSSADDEESSSSNKDDSDSSSSSSGDESDADEKVERSVKKKPTTASNDKEESDDESDGDESESDSDADDEEDSEDGEKKGGGAFFTDENAAWLKPKKKVPQQQKKGEKKKSQLVSSSSDEEKDDDDDEFDTAASDGSEDDDEEMLEVEKQSRLLDAEIESEQRDAKEEYERTIARHTEVFHLPTPDELAEEENRVVPPSEIRSRIDSILGVLSSFQARREPGRSRTEYIDQLTSDLAELYGYLPELVSYLLSMLGPNETLEYIDSSDKPRPVVIRTNTLKARRKDLASALIKRGMTLDPLAPWSKVGLKVSASPVPVGATPEYLAGHYMLQSAASMCPVMALSPQPNERVLDMSAAPGGKTSYISQLMRNTGIVIANDLKSERQKATVANMHRLGVRNVVTCTGDGRKIGDKMRRRFDRVLLDAPCSGLGVISRDPSVKVSRTMADIGRCGHLQKELLLAAIDALNHKSKSGGVMVYSTCSVAVAENEEVVNYVLGKRDVRVVDAGLDFGKPGFTRYQHKRFHPSLALTRRFYPHVHNMDGFYVAKLQKLSDKRPGDDAEKKKQEEEEQDEKTESTGEDGEDKEVPKDRDEAALKSGGKANPDEIEKAQKAVSTDVGDVSDKKKKDRKQHRGKKRGATNGAGADKVKNKKVKRGQVSFPPRQQEKQQKKKKTNAKVTKPRRPKKTAVESTGDS